MIYERHETADCIQWDGSNQNEILIWAEERGFSGYYDDGTEDVIPGLAGFEKPHPYIKFGCGSESLEDVGDWLMIFNGDELRTCWAEGFEREGWQPKP